MNNLTLTAIVGSLTLCTAGIVNAQDQPTPAADAAATQNPAIKSPNDMTHAPLAKGQNSFTRSEARSRIRSAGYRQVKDLAMDSNGLWQAHATKDGQVVHVALDYKGNVSSQ